MTETIWLASTDPTPMLEYLRGRVSDRKLILFSAACCRHIWEMLHDERCRAAVEMAERFADGRVGLKELIVARTPTIDAEKVVGLAARAAYWTANQHPAETVWNVHTAAAEAEALAATRAVTSRWAEVWDDHRAAAVHAQADLLRDIVGNPFRPVIVDPAWMTWAGGTVRRIAHDIYEKRRFEELPVLADALEDAGCDNPELLTHCRSEEQHVRGCWAVDVLVSRM